MAALRGNKHYYRFTDNKIVGDNESGTLKAHEYHVNAGEYYLQYESGEYFSFQCRHTAKYVSTANEGHVTANRGERQKWELFKFNGSEDSWGTIVCNRDNKAWYYWYTQSDGAIHHEAISQYDSLCPM